MKLGMEHLHFKNAIIKCNFHQFEFILRDTLLIGVNNL